MRAKGQDNPFSGYGAGRSAESPERAGDRLHPGFAASSDSCGVRSTPDPEIPAPFSSLGVSPGCVLRNGILGRLFVPDSAPISLFQGPAGHGKSTLMQQARTQCIARGMRTHWLSFEEADNDLRRLLAQLQALMPGGEVLDAIPAANPVPESRSRRLRSDWFIARLAGCEKPVALFFDEFQSLNTQVVLGFFKDLFEHLPDGIRVFIGSRTLPEIGLPRLVVNGKALVVRADELRFTPAEVARFFSSSGDLAVNGEELDAIHRHTEGWPAALQLFRLSLFNPAIRRSLGNLDGFRPRELAEYLADNVLSMQPPRVQEFLLRTSVLARLSAPLCDSILGTRDAQGILEQLERSGLFLRSIDADRCWFRYHALFASFLSDQLRESSDTAVDDVHRRACRWYREAGLYEEAMHHAIAMQDTGEAADIFSIWAPQLIPEAHLLTIERWYDRLPFAEIEKRPRLAVVVAWAFTFLRRHHKLRPLLECLDRRAKWRGEGPDPAVVRSMVAILLDDIPLAFRTVDPINVRELETDGFRAFELGAVANVKGYLAMTAGDFESAHEYLALARAHGERAHAPFSWAYSVSTTGVNLMIQGQHEEALERFRLGMTEPRIYLDESSASASLVSCHVQALYEVGDLKAAEAQFVRFHDVIANTALLDYLAVAYVSMSRIHQVHGRSAKAVDLLAEAEAIGLGSGWPRLVRIVGWERVRRALLAGELERARSIAQHIPPLPEGSDPRWLPFAEDSEGEALGRIRLLIAAKEFTAAHDGIGRALVGATAEGRVRRQIKLNILDAICLQGLGREAEALMRLIRALRQAAPGGLMRSFLDEDATALLPLLRASEKQLARSDESTSVGRRLLETLLHWMTQAGPGKPAGHVARDSLSIEPLTERERRLLAFLADGVSNKEIASQVFVSENTVKFHLKNIYSKLGVGSRLQAINAARQMGLLDDRVDSTG